MAVPIERGFFLYFLNFDSLKYFSAFAISRAICSRSASGPKNFFSFAKPRVEPDLHRPARNLFAKREQMALDGDAVPVKRWPCAHVRHRKIRLSHHHGFGRVHPEFRQQFLLRDHIERGEQDCPPASRARANFAAQRKRPPKQGNGVCHISAGNCVAHGSAGNDPPLDFHWRDNFHIKAVRFSIFARADARSRRRDVRNRNSLPPEWFRRAGRRPGFAAMNSSGETRDSARSKRRTSAASRPNLLDARKALRKRLNHPRRLLRAKHAQRMRIERDDRRSAALRPAPAPQPAAGFSGGPDAGRQSCRPKARRGARAPKRCGPLFGGMQNGKRHQSRTSKCSPS